jgi:dUTPase
MAKNDVKIQPMRDGEPVEKAPERPSPLLYQGNPMSFGKLRVPVSADESTVSVPPGKEVMVRTGFVYNKPGHVALFHTTDSGKFIINSIQELVPGEEVTILIKNIGIQAWKILKGQTIAGMVVVEAVQI